MHGARAALLGALMAPFLLAALAIGLAYWKLVLTVVAVIVGGAIVLLLIDNAGTAAGYAAAQRQRDEEIAAAAALAMLDPRAPAPPPRFGSLADRGETVSDRAGTPVEPLPPPPATTPPVARSGHGFRLPARWRSPRYGSTRPPFTPPAD